MFVSKAVWEAGEGGIAVLGLLQAFTEVWF